MKILLTNDDGIQAPGIRALYEALSGETEMLVTAPAGARSASGHAISLERSIRVKEKKWAGVKAYAVEGTPADCVKFALAELKFKPDLVLSGVNLGPNTGISVFYSGTVSAAREGLFSGAPALAVSVTGFRCTDYRGATDIIRRLIQGHKTNPLPHEIMLNINVPVLPHRSIKGVKITRQAPSRFVEDYRSTGAGKKRSYRLAGEILLLDPDGTSDEEAVKDGFISITPLHIDLTAYHEMEHVRRWYGMPSKKKPRNGHARDPFKLH